MSNYNYNSQGGFNGGSYQYQPRQGGSYTTSRNFGFSQRQSYRGNQYNGGNYQYAPNQNYRGSQPRYKKSGVTYSTINAEKSDYKGYPIINAWYKNRHGLTKISVTPYNKSPEIVTSEKGHEYMKMIAEFVYPMGHKEITACLYSEKTRKVFIKDKNMLITPNGGGHTRSGKYVKGAVVQLKK